MSIGNQSPPQKIAYEEIRKSGSTDVIERLFAENLDLLAFRVPSAGTWLHLAASYGSTEMIEYFLVQGLDINSKANSYGDTPIHRAAMEPRPENVKYLLNHGAELDVSTSVGNPLFGAIVGRSPECARLLLDAGIDTSASYVLEGEVKIQSDAIAFAMLRGETEIAHMVALHNAQGDAAKARELVAEGDRIAELRTAA
jgi:uncharacterized protein